MQALVLWRGVPGPPPQEETPRSVERGISLSAGLHVLCGTLLMCVRVCSCACVERECQTGGVCLGDYCDILRCHEYQEKAPIGAASTGCTPATLEKRKFECKVRNYTLVSCIVQNTGRPNSTTHDTRGVQLQSVMHKCFPPEAGEAAHRLNAQFTRSFCDELSCTPTESKRVRQHHPPSRALT